MKTVFIYAADDSYSMPLGTSIRSLVDTSVRSDGASILVFDCGLTETSRRRIRACTTAGWEIHYFRLPQEWCEDLPAPGRFTRAAYARLFTDRVAEEADLAIYLDADTLVIRSIDKLLGVELGGMIAAGVQDEYIPTIGSAEGIKDWTRFALDPQAPYFNSGVLVIDVGEWRRAEVGERALWYLKRARSGLEYADQEALNFALHRKWNRLPTHWNVGRYWYRAERREGCFRDIVKRARILHYTTEYKPWTLPGKVPCWSRQPFFSYLDRTPWAGWRPKGYKDPT